MLFIIQQFIALIKLLHSENSDSKIAWAFVLGLFASVSPVLSLQGVVFICIALFVRVQLGAFLLSWLLFSILTLPFVGIFHSLGASLLSLESLRAVYVFMQSGTFLSLTRFNNTIVLGGFLLALFFAPIFFVFFKWVIVNYRRTFVAYIKSTRVYYAINSSVFIKVYEFYGKYGKA